MEMNTIILLAILFFVLAIFYSLQKGFNQVIAGLTALNDQLTKQANRTDKQ